jgi:hypothetical protein
VSVASTSSAITSALLVAEPVLDDVPAAPKIAEPKPAAPKRPDLEVFEPNKPVYPLLTAIGVALWRARLLLGSSSLSATIHFGIVLALTMIAVVPEFKTPKTPPREPILASIVKPKLLPTIEPAMLEPVKMKIEPSMKIESPRNLAASGNGSAGSGGGSGGGNVGGNLASGIDIGPLAVASGGTGAGVEKAYGNDMLGDVGEYASGNATFFGVKAEGRKFVFVVDTSGSMRINERYLRCRVELLRSISEMKYGQQYFIVFFSDQLYFMPENKLVEAKPDQLKKTSQWLVGAIPSGGTEPWPGMQRALSMKPDAIFLLTDGQFDPQVVHKLDVIQPETKKKIPIHTIAFESPQGAMLLEAISKQSGGTHRFVP